MKCNLSKDKLIGYYYQEIEPDEKKLVEEHLSTCTICKKELGAFANTSNLLRTWSDEESNIKYNFVQEKASLWNNMKMAWLTGNNWRRLTLGLASGLAAALVILSVFNFEANYSEGNFNVKLSLFPQPKSETNEPDDQLAMPITQGEFNAWQKESFQLIQRMIKSTVEQQRNEQELKLVQFARDLDQQRRYDLRIVGEGLEVFQLTNENRFRRTNETLNELIRAANFESYQQQPRQNK